MRRSCRAFLTPYTVVVAVVLAALLLLLPAQGVAATMSAAEAPPVVSNPSVKAGAGGERHESFEVELAFALICPGGRTPLPVTVSFTDANGETTERLSHPCNGEWATNDTVQPNQPWEWSVMTFSGFAPVFAGEAGSPPYVLFSPSSEASGPDPFLYQVAGPGGVIAQAPITATTTPEQRITEADNAFQENCASSGNVKRDANGTDYCVLPTTTTYTAGWPATPRPRPRAVLLCANASSTTSVPRVKPTRCKIFEPLQLFTAGNKLAKLRWHAWGSAKATATGVELGAHTHSHVPVKLRAYRLRRCSETEAMYTRLRVHDRRGTRVFGVPRMWYGLIDPCRQPQPK
jgi:hypothetical protein